MCNQFPDHGFLFDLNSNRESICKRLDVVREAGVFFRQVRKSSDPSSLTFCCGGIFLRRLAIFGRLVDISADNRTLHMYPE